MAFASYTLYSHYIAYFICEKKTAQKCCYDFAMLVNPQKVCETTGSQGVVFDANRYSKFAEQKNISFQLTEKIGI